MASIVLNPLAKNYIAAMEALERELADLIKHPDAEKERRVLNQMWMLIDEMKAAQLASTPGWQQLERRTTGMRQ